MLLLFILPSVAAGLFVANTCANDSLALNTTWTAKNTTGSSAGCTLRAPCDSPLYCYGPLLQAVQMSGAFSDSKTFVDMPTRKPLREVLEDFEDLPQPVRNNSALWSFLDECFGEAGSEIEELDSAPEAQADFLTHVESPVLRSFVRQIVDYWPELTRRYVGTGANCSDCVSSFIPLNRTFLVAGGRYREPYYWDSFFILEGLLRSGSAYQNIGRNIIENFLDLVERYGFVPNGARVYYLNRSQPPLLTQMVRIYVEYTRDETILERAVPILERELNFWYSNRSVSINTTNGSTFAFQRYHVENNQPRPEGYREDYATARNQSDTLPSLNSSQQAQVYSDLASAAESGWDFSSRWISDPSTYLASDSDFPLRGIRTSDIVPVDLNSIMYMNEKTMAEFYLTLSSQQANASWPAQAHDWLARAESRQEAMYSLMFNSSVPGYFDYNLTSHSLHLYLPADGVNGTWQSAEATSQFYPFWAEAVPEHIIGNATIMQAVWKPIRALLADDPGGVPATNFESGQQWDEPNVWPPLQYILIQGLRNVQRALDTSETQANVTTSSVSLAREIARRYVKSAYCTWRSTGGSVPRLVPKLANSSSDANGTMFEKYADNSTDAAGGGGEYEVVPGFGWSNGVLIWIANTFTDLATPECGNITAADTTTTESLLQKRGLEGGSTQHLPFSPIHVGTRRARRRRSSIV